MGEPRPHLDDGLGALRVATAAADRSAAERTALAGVACRIAALRRHREALLGPLGEGGWELLLDIYARGNGRVAVADLCHVGAQPPATTLRLIAALEEAGKLIPVDAADGRRGGTVALTPAATAAVETFLEDVRDAGF